MAAGPMQDLGHLAPLKLQQLALHIWLAGDGRNDCAEGLATGEITNALPLASILE